MEWLTRILSGYGVRITLQAWLKVMSWVIWRMRSWLCETLSSFTPAFLTSHSFTHRLVTPRWFTKEALTLFWVWDDERMIKSKDLTKTKMIVSQRWLSHHYGSPTMLNSSTLLLEMLVESIKSPIFRGQIRLIDFRQLHNCLEGQEYQNKPKKFGKFWLRQNFAHVRQSTAFWSLSSPKSHKMSVCLAF